LEVKEKKEQDEKQFYAQREQRQIYLEDMDGKNISSLELVNTLPNGKIQTINSMKYHSRKLESEYNIPFKYHYLRHTYGTKLAVLNTPTHLLCNQMRHSSSNVTQKYYIAMSEEGIDMLLDNLDRFYGV